MKPELPRPYPSDPGPVARLLGPEEAAGGPLALLGLTIDTCNDASIKAALQRQLDRVNAHPQAATPEAEQLRLSLYAAAAQLSDPNVRSHLLARAQPVRSEPLSEPARPAVPQRAPIALAPWTLIRLRKELRQELARAGGLNQRSIRAVARAARRHRVPLELVPRLLPTILRPGPHAQSAAPAALTGQVVAPAQPFARLTPSRPGDGVPTAGGATEPAEAEIDPAERFGRNFLLFGSIAVALLGAMLVIIWWANRVPASATPTPVPAPDAIPITRSDAARPKGELFPADAERRMPAPPDVVAPALDADAVPAELAQCVEAFPIDASSACARFGAAVHALGKTWDTLPPDRLIAAQDSVVEFVYRVSRTPELAGKVAEMVALDSAPLQRGVGPIPPNAVLPGVCSVGLLSRLSRERDLAAPARHVIESAIAAAADGSAVDADATFQAGATAAVRAMPSLFIKPDKSTTVVTPDVWKAWLRAVAGVTAGDDAARSRLILAALETVLIDAPDPPADPKTASPVSDAIAELALALPWRDNDESRRRLLRWIDSAAVSSADLHVLTRTLATRSGVQGFDVTTVLAPDAAEPQRARLRQLLSTAWNIDAGPQRDELVSSWAEAARAALASDPPSDPVQELAQAVLLSRLSEIAALLDAGETSAPGDLLRTLDEPVKAALSAAQTRTPLRTLDDGASDGSWSLRYLQADKSVPARLALLGELSRSTGRLNSADSEAVAVDAVRGTPWQVRRAAAEIVLQQVANPAMVNAVLEQASGIPRSNDCADLVSRLTGVRLPPLRDPQWRIAVRRALVETLLAQLAGRGEEGIVDTLAELLGKSYEQRAALTKSATAGKSRSPEEASEALAALWLRWARAATPSGREPMSLEAILRRRAARSDLSSGRVQAFLAEQRATAELMGYVVSTEQPSEVARIAPILNTFAERCRTTNHAFSQARAGEEAMLRLWLMRLGVAP